MKQTKEHFVGISYDELLAENAKLRTERDEWHRVAVSKQDVIDHMRDARAENAKLRELYSYFLRQKKLAGCFDCFGGNCEEWGKCHGDCVFESRARELGVEVNA